VTYIAPKSYKNQGVSNYRLGNFKSRWCYSCAEMSDWMSADRSKYDARCTMAEKFPYSWFCSLAERKSQLWIARKLGRYLLRSCKPVTKVMPCQKHVDLALWHCAPRNCSCKSGAGLRGKNIVVCVLYTRDEWSRSETQWCEVKRIYVTCVRQRLWRTHVLHLSSNHSCTIAAADTGWQPRPPTFSMHLPS